MLKKMSIGKRLIMAFIFVALIVSVSGLTGLALMVTMNKNYGEALVSNGFIQGDIGDYNAYLNKGGAVVRDIIMLKNESEIKEAQAELEDIKVKTQAALDAVKANQQTQEELDLIAKIDAVSPKYKEGRNKAIELGLANKYDEALKVFREEARPYLNECMGYGQQLMELNKNMGNQVSAELTKQAKFAIIIIIAVIIIGFLIAICLGIYMSRGIAKPLKEIETVAKKMAVGDYDVDIAYQSEDEVGRLADSMRHMMTATKDIIQDTTRGLHEIAKGNFNLVPQVEFIGIFKNIEDAITQIIFELSETIQQIKISADRVSSSSNQVSSGAQLLAQGATEQASSVQELSASINEIALKINNNARNAATVSMAVSGVDDNILSSNEHMKELMQAMAKISDSSSQIGKIIKTIDDIAFQTNILALNAAVEAARAGSAGKGFAVVADEVRNLATKSSEAAKQTNVLIEDSFGRVENGVTIADETAKSLAEVVVGANEITALIIKISETSAEQANFISQINIGVEQISSVVQTNSATSEESAAASEELSSQAVIMEQMVSKFKLKK